MPQLEVEMIVNEPLRTSGGPVFVSINPLPKDEFEARHRKDQAEPSSGSAVVRVHLSAVVNFVEIDTPEGSYVYRFVNDPKRPHASDVIQEAPIGEAGVGALYIDLATNEPVNSNGGRDHHLLGGSITKDESVEIQNNSLDLRVDPTTCVVSGPVRVCPARQDEVDWLLEIIRSGDR